MKKNVFIAAVFIFVFFANAHISNAYIDSVTDIQNTNSAINNYSNADSSGVETSIIIKANTKNGGTASAVIQNDIEANSDKYKKQNINIEVNSNTSEIIIQEEESENQSPNNKDKNVHKVIKTLNNNGGVIINVKSESNYKNNSTTSIISISNENKKGKNKYEQIIILGDEIRKTYSNLEKDISAFNNLDANNIQSNEDLIVFIASKTIKDKNIDKIVINNEDVTVKYKVKAKLFGLIPITMGETIHISNTKKERVEFELPWWHIFTIKKINNNKLKNSINTAINKLDGLKILNKNTKEALYIETLISILHEEADSSSIINKNMEKITYKVKTPEGGEIQIVGNYWTGDNGKGIILLHMMPATKESWNNFADKLNKLGWSVLAIDLRGHGESNTYLYNNKEKEIDFRNFSDEEHKQSIDDVIGAREFLINKGIPPQNIYVGGASIGANLAIQYISMFKDSPGVFALSPGLNYRGVDISSMPIDEKIKDNIMLVASDDDQYSSESVRGFSKLANIPDKNIKIFNSGGHGTTLFETHPELIDDLINWLSKGE